MPKGRELDPQFTTQGAYRQLDETVAAFGLMMGPREGQHGVPHKKSPPPARAGRQTVRARRGQDETTRKTGLGEKAKNAHQLRNPAERKKRQLGPVGRERAGIGRRPKGRSQTSAGIWKRNAGASSPKGSPNAKRREMNRGKRAHAGGSPRKQRGP